jgi:hypothetical protein
MTNAVAAEIRISESFGRTIPGEDAHKDGIYIRPV